jgi:hypothetical protein
MSTLLEILRKDLAIQGPDSFAQPSLSALLPNELADLDFRHCADALREAGAPDLLTAHAIPHIHR